MEAFYCRLRDQQSPGGYKEGFIGIAVDLQMVMQPHAEAPGGVVTNPKVAVLWFKQGEGGLIPTEQPSPAFHDPAELQSLGLYNGEDWEEDTEYGETGEQTSAESLQGGTVVTDSEHNSAMQNPPIQKVAPPQESLRDTPREQAVDPLSVPVTGTVRPRGSAPNATRIPEGANSVNIDQVPPHLRPRS